MKYNIIYIKRRKKVVLEKVKKYSEKEWQIFGILCFSFLLFSLHLPFVSNLYLFFERKKREDEELNWYYVFFMCLHVIVKLFIFKTCFCVLIGNTQTDGISLLGSAIGYEGFLSQFLEAKLNDFKNLVRFFIQNTIFSCSLLTLTQYTLSDLYRPHHQPLSNSAVTVFLLYLDPFLTCFIYHRYPIRVRAFWKWLVNQT